MLLECQITLLRSCSKIFVTHAKSNVTEYAVENNHLQDNKIENTNIQQKE